MKKVALIALVFGLASAGVFAATPSTPWTWQLQAGYSGSSKWMDSGWMTGTGVGYQFTDNFKLNFDLNYYEGKIKDSGQKDHIWAFYAAPQYTYHLSDNDQVYGFVGVGVADRQSKTYDAGTLGRIHVPGESKFAWEGGFGYNHFFNKNLGLNLQATYSRMNFTDRVSPVDGRVGIVVRF